MGKGFLIPQPSPRDGEETAKNTVFVPTLLITNGVEKLAEELSNEFTLEPVIRDATDSAENNHY